jgi:hypothetical protein
MESKSIVEVEESVQGALEALPSILRSRPSGPLTQLLADAVSILAPAGYHPVVELQENGRRKRRTASADNWTPETGEILISFSKDDLSPQDARFKEIPAQHGLDSSPAADTIGPRRLAPAAHARVSASAAGASLEREENELCSTLEEVERQGRAFIALKWFRDDVLTSKGFAWALDSEQRQAVLASAIEKGLIVTSRVPNPRSPFPTTSIRLNRAPVTPQTTARRYSPVKIQGEPLSSTISRDRGSY